MIPNIDRKLARKAGLLVLVLAAAWILPPAVHQTLHYCPVSPDGVSQAQAVPAFARKYGFSCMQCHSNWPTLNEYGRQFKLNGYVPSRDSEEGVLKTKDGAMWIEKNFPISVVVRSRPFDQTKKVDQEFKMQAVSDVNVFAAGGDAAHHVSWFGEFDANADGGFAPGIGDVALGYHYNEYFNIVGARRGFFVADPFQTITNFGSPTLKGRGTSGTEFANPQLSMYSTDQSAQTIYGYGEVGKDSVGYLYYSAGVQADKGNDSGNGGKSVNARLAFDTMKGLIIGAFGGVGHAGVSSLGGCNANDAVCIANGGLTTTAATDAPIDRTAFKRGGVDLLVEKGRFTGRAAALFAYDHDVAAYDAVYFPLGDTRETNRAAYVEAQYSYLRGDSKVPFLIPLIRQNWYTTTNGKRQFSYFTAQLAHYFAANLKGFVEASWDTKQDIVGYDSTIARAPKGSRLTAQLEVGF
ncbi:MAG: hypothetical protein PHS14_14880 [Elusimicrobia bacterium]|nr:hypothetical protein [Elusimicrobiota bacterium]